ncbi:MAG: WhiB family transcriptional regulator [Acidimicrobiales bacterium]
MILTGAPQWDATFEWRQRAACRNVEVDLFFPIGVTGPAVEHIAAAKAVCAGCAVRSDCLEFAITTNQEFGVWGGTSEEERRALRREWRAARRLAVRSAAS